MARGVSIREEALGSAPIEALNISTIGIVGTAPDAAVNENKNTSIQDKDRVFTNPDGSIKYNEPILLTKRGDARIGDEGSLPLALDTIYAQGGATVAMVIVPKTEDTPNQAEIASLATKLVDGTSNLAAAGDYAISEVSGQLSISFHTLSDAQVDNLQASAIGRILTVGAGNSAVTYVVAGKYVSTSKRIPVTKTSTTNLPSPLPSSTTLALAAQAAVVGKDEDRTAATGSVDENTGVYALLDAESVVGRKPRLIGAPGLDVGSRPSDAKNPLAAALEIVATKLRGIAYLDGPNTTHAAALEYVEDFNTARTYVLDPGGYVTNDEGELVPAAMSGFALGVTARVDSQDGWWNSPSNRPILGLQKLARPIDYSPGDANSRAVLLNTAGCATVIRYQGGFKLFGVRTTATSDPAFKFSSVRRIADNIEDSVQDAMFYYVDKNITKNFLQQVVNRSNGFLRNMVSLGVLIGGECFVDADLNTKESLALGKVYFNVKFTPPYPAEEIIFTFSLVNDYLTNLTI